MSVIRTLALLFNLPLLMLAILLTLPLILLHQLGRTILDQLARLVQSCPLRQAIGNVHDTLTVEHVAPRLKIELRLIVWEVNQAREQQDHILSLIHDRAMTERASHFARQLVLNALVCWIVPFKIMMSLLEVDVFLVENGCPLEGCCMLGLTCRAVA